MIRVIKIMIGPNLILTEKHSYIYAKNYQFIITRFINGAILIKMQVVEQLNQMIKIFRNFDEGNEYWKTLKIGASLLYVNISGNNYQFLVYFKNKNDKDIAKTVFLQFANGETKD